MLISVYGALDNFRTTYSLFDLLFPVSPSGGLKLLNCFLVHVLRVFRSESDEPVKHTDDFCSY